MCHNSHAIELSWPPGWALRWPGVMSSATARIAAKGREAASVRMSRASIRPRYAAEDGCGRDPAARAGGVPWRDGHFGTCRFPAPARARGAPRVRSEERRVGKEGRSRWARGRYTKRVATEERRERRMMEDGECS